MLMQNLRGRIGSRLSGNSEAGFTLIELLVVMLILGILAAIAIPAFFNQKSKANDAQGKAYAHSAQVAMETYATDNNGSYAGVTPAKLVGIENTLTGANTAPWTLTTPVATPSTYTVTVRVPSTGNSFSVNRGLAAPGSLSFTCTTANTGGCPIGGNWGQ